MDPRLKKLAVGAVRVAAMTQLGPIAGGLFLAGGAVAGKVFAEEMGPWAKASAEMLMHLASHKASEWFGAAIEGFRGLRDEDLEKSMQQAARIALDELRGEAPPGFGEWFDDWRSVLTLRSAAEVFRGCPGMDPVTLEYDDAEFRKLWWKRMEAVLLGWRAGERLSIHPVLPPALAEFLRERLPEAMQAAHEHVLREKKRPLINDVLETSA